MIYICICLEGSLGVPFQIYSVFLIFLFSYFLITGTIIQGERKGQENLKNDLVRRIKMLEYALKQERAKYSKLKYGGDGGDIGPPPQDEDGVELPPLDQSENIIAVTNSNWKQVFLIDWLIDLSIDIEWYWTCCLGGLGGPQWGLLQISLPYDSLWLEDWHWFI